MAKAELVSPKPEVRLLLTYEEAEALHAVTMKTAGSPTATRRGLIDKIEKALREVGIWSDLGDILGGVTFAP